MSVRAAAGRSDHRYHNNGDGTFTDRKREGGSCDAKGYYDFIRVRGRR